MSNKRKGLVDNSTQDDNEVKNTNRSPVRSGPSFTSSHEPKRLRSLAASPLGHDGFNLLRMDLPEDSSEDEDFTLDIGLDDGLALDDPDLISRHTRSRKSLRNVSLEQLEQGLDRSYEQLFGLSQSQSAAGAISHSDPSHISSILDAHLVRRSPRKRMATQSLDSLFADPLLSLEADLGATNVRSVRQRRDGTSADVSSAGGLGRTSVLSDDEDDDEYVPSGSGSDDVDVDADADQEPASGDEPELLMLSAGELASRKARTRLRRRRRVASAQSATSDALTAPDGSTSIQNQEDTLRGSADHRAATASSSRRLDGSASLPQEEADEEFTMSSGDDDSSDNSQDYEELRNDRSVRISAKEVRDVTRAGQKDSRSLSGAGSRSRRRAGSGGAVNRHNVIGEGADLVPENLEMLLPSANAALDTGVQPFTVFTESQLQRLRSQLASHMQLLVQAHALTAYPLDASVTTSSKRWHQVRQGVHRAYDTLKLKEAHTKVKSHLDELRNLAEGSLSADAVSCVSSALAVYRHSRGLPALTEANKAAAISQALPHLRTWFDLYPIRAYSTDLLRHIRRLALVKRETSSKLSPSAMLVQALKPLAASQSRSLRPPTLAQDVLPSAVSMSATARASLTSEVTGSRTDAAPDIAGAGASSAAALLDATGQYNNALRTGAAAAAGSSSSLTLFLNSSSEPDTVSEDNAIEMDAAALMDRSDRSVRGYPIISFLFAALPFLDARWKPPYDVLSMRARAEARFSHSEDILLVKGLERFSTLAPNWPVQDVSSTHLQDERNLAKVIQAFDVRDADWISIHDRFLPAKTLSQIKVRFRNMRNRKAPSLEIGRANLALLNAVPNLSVGDVQNMVAQFLPQMQAQGISAIPAPPAASSSSASSAVTTLAASSQSSSAPKVDLYRGSGTREVRAKAIAGFTAEEHQLLLTGLAEFADAKQKKWRLIQKKFLRGKRVAEIRWMDEHIRKSLLKKQRELAGPKKPRRVYPPVPLFDAPPSTANPASTANSSLVVVPARTFLKSAAKMVMPLRSVATSASAGDTAPSARLSGGITLLYAPKQNQFVQAAASSSSSASSANPSTSGTASAQPLVGVSSSAGASLTATAAGVTGSSGLLDARIVVPGADNSNSLFAGIFPVVSRPAGAHPQQVIPTDSWAPSTPARFNAAIDDEGFVPMTPLPDDQSLPPTPLKPAEASRTADAVPMSTRPASTQGQPSFASFNAQLRPSSQPSAVAIAATTSMIPSPPTAGAYERDGFSPASAGSMASPPAVSTATVPAPAAGAMSASVVQPLSREPNSAPCTISAQAANASAVDGSRMTAADDDDPEFVPEEDSSDGEADSVSSSSSSSSSSVHATPDAAAKAIGPQPVRVSEPATARVTKGPISSRLLPFASESTPSADVRAGAHLSAGPPTPGSTLASSSSTAPTNALPTRTLSSMPLGSDAAQPGAPVGVDLAGPASSGSTSASASAVEQIQAPSGFGSATGLASDTVSVSNSSASDITWSIPQDDVLLRGMLRFGLVVSRWPWSSDSELQNVFPDMLVVLEQSASGVTKTKLNVEVLQGRLDYLVRRLLEQKKSDMQPPM